jgi:hypothetical protein
MAKQITIDEKAWKLLQKKLLDKLKLDKFECGVDTTLNHEQRQRMSHLHGMFHYHVCGFFSEVEDA